MKKLAEQIKDAQVRWLATRSAKFDLICKFLFSFLAIYFWLTDPRASNGYLIWALSMLALILVSAGLNISASHLARQKITLSVARQVNWLEKVKGLHSHVVTFAWLVPAMLSSSRDEFLENHFVRGLLGVALGMIILGTVLGAIGERIGNTSLRKKLAAANEDDLPPPDTASA